MQESAVLVVVCQIVLTARNPTKSKTNRRGKEEEKNRGKRITEKNGQRGLVIGQMGWVPEADTTIFNAYQDIQYGAYKYIK